MLLQCEALSGQQIFTLEFIGLVHLVSIGITWIHKDWDESSTKTLSHLISWAWTGCRLVQVPSVKVNLLHLRKKQDVQAAAQKMSPLAEGSVFFNSSISAPFLFASSSDKNSWH